MKTVKEILRDTILEFDGGEPSIEIFNIEIDIPLLLKDDIEGIELENWSITSIEDYKMTMYCGGDWEEPKKLDIEVIDDRLTLISFEEGLFEDGFSEDELIAKIL